jgi:hypothetical protein
MDFRDKDSLGFFKSGKSSQSFPQKLETTGRLPLLLVNRLLAYKAQAFASPTLFHKTLGKPQSEPTKVGAERRFLAIPLRQAPANP